MMSCLDIFPSLPISSSLDTVLSDHENSLLSVSSLGMLKSWVWGLELSDSLMWILSSE